MISLFEKANIDFRSMSEYINWFIDPKDEHFNNIQLPPIQRNSVWNSQQIERLWDSVLRGFPIGSFLLAERNEGESSRDILLGTQTLSKSKGYFLLDGQQRTRSLILGFRPNSDSRLWIDLNPIETFDNAEFNDRKYLFRLITKYQPWGMNDRNPSDKVSENEKFQARTKLHENSVRYDYKVKINVSKTNVRKEDKYSWPIKASLPVPFDALMNLCGGTSGNYCEPDWHQVLELLPWQIKQKNDILPDEHYFEILKAIAPIIENGPNNTEIKAVAFLKQNISPDKDIRNESHQDPMEVLFRRVNSNGTPLAGEEMAYSLLKSNWDKAYDLVSEIINDKKIGYLFSSTGVVMAAARIARFDIGANDTPQPNGSDFRRWMGEKIELGQRPFLEKMKDLINKNNQKSFHNILQAFCDLVLYRFDSDPADIGLPRKLILSVKPSLIHPVLIWIYKNFDNPEIFEQNRISVLRYIILTIIGIGSLDKDKASKIAVEIIKETSGNFPGKEIFERWTEEDWIGKVPTAKQFLETIKNTADGLFRTEDEIFGIEDDEYRWFRKQFWFSKELLLYYQRSYHAKWFAGYNPMSNDAYDTPYDYDHILPRSHLITSGGINIYIANDSDRKKFYNHRYLFINSIGNFRAWPAWAKRSDNNKCHSEKLRFNLDNFQSDETAVELGLGTVADFLNASVIPIQDLDIWKAAKGNPREWPEERRCGWQTAVEKRSDYLYSILYRNFNFEGLNSSTS